MGFPDPNGGDLVQEDDDEIQYTCLSHRRGNEQDESSEPFSESPLVHSLDAGKLAILQELQVDERDLFHNVGSHSASFDDSERVATLISLVRSGARLDEPSRASESTFGAGRSEGGTSNDVDASGVPGRLGTHQGKLSRPMEKWTDDSSHEAFNNTGPKSDSPPRRTVQSYEEMSFGGAIWRLKFPDGRVIVGDNYFRVAITEPLKKVLKEAFTEAFGFMMIKLHLQSFIRPTLAESRDNAELNGNGEHMSQRVETTEQERDCRSLWQRTQRTLRDVFVVAGYMEPPLNPNWSRLRWRCRCGDAFWSDVMEYRPGGINRAIQRMEQATGTKVTVTSHNKSSTNQNWSFNMPRWTQYFLPGARPGSNKTPKLPQHNPPVPISTQTTLATAGLSPPSGVSIRLLACIHRTQDRKFLLQEPIDEVNNDLSLFFYMKRQLKHHRGRLQQLLSLRSVRGIHFVKVYLRTGNLVEVREHSRYCVSIQPADTSTRMIPCDCIPPEPKREPAPNAEYRCTVDDLDTGAGPPVNPTFLLHMLNSTNCISKDSKSIFNILPRRICGQLQGGDLKPAVGWGIYYEEGLDADMVISVMFAILLLGSVLFGILWSVLKMDIQGAFGVSSYMMTASGIIIAWIATRAKNYG